MKTNKYRIGFIACFDPVLSEANPMYIRTYVAGWLAKHVNIYQQLKTGETKLEEKTK